MPPAFPFVSPFSSLSSRRRVDAGWPGGAPPSGRVGLRRRAWLACLLGASLLATKAGAQITAPAYNWALPVFSNEGFRSMIARGSQAQMSAPGQFDVVDLNLTLYGSDPKDPVDSIILSPAATFLPDTKIARGDKLVRFIGRGVDATGVRWTYSHAEKKISLDGAVQVTFNAELKDLLK